jgi:Protein of unknown function (DUF1189)
MNIFKQFYKSIYSPRDISLFRLQGIGKTILYVFFLTFISILPTIFYLITAISSGVETARTIIKNDVPPFTVENGVLTADTDVPVTIEKDEFSFILDPTGTLSDEDVADVADEETALALLKDEFVFTAGGTTDSYHYSMIEGFYITNTDLLDIIEMVDGVKGIMIPIISVIIFLISSAVNFIEVSILAIFGIALTNLSASKLNYGQLWRMSAYSETLPTIFFTIMAAINTPVPNSFMINWFVAIIVLYLAIREVPKPKNKNLD